MKENFWLAILSLLLGMLCIFLGLTQKKLLYGQKYRLLFIGILAIIGGLIVLFS